MKKDKVGGLGSFRGVSRDLLAENPCFSSGVKHFSDVYAELGLIILYYYPLSALHIQLGRLRKYK